jgi:hypothetical protein
MGGGVIGLEWAKAYVGLKFELELIQTQMAQEPVLRAELYARALRASQNVKRAEVLGWWRPRGRQPLRVLLQMFFSFSVMEEKYDESTVWAVGLKWVEVSVGLVAA